jgi:hypothetical protein
MMGYMPWGGSGGGGGGDYGDRGSGMRGPRPPYVMVGYGNSDMYGMPYGPAGGRPIASGTRCDEVDSYKQMGLRQKMKKQYVKRGFSVPSLTHCQRLCTNEVNFICRSFNYREEGDRAAPQGAGENFNCELSDRDTRELDLTNPQQFESGNSDFYERSIGSRSNDGECLDVSQVCNEDGMEFTLRTNEQFTGRIYSYGFYDR